MHHAWGLVSPFNKMAVMLFTECLCQKLNFHRSHVGTLMIGTRVRIVARLSLTIGTSRLEQLEVVDTSVIVQRRA